MPFRLCRKGTSLPRRIAGVSVWQESLRRPRRKYSPEGTPPGSSWETWNLFVLKTSIIREEPAMSLLTLISRALEKNLQLLFKTILHHDALS